jgi:hypothetical protein
MYISAICEGSGLTRMTVTSPENAPLGANIAQGIDIFWD